MLEQTAFWEQHHFKVLTLSSKNPDKTQVSRLRKKIQDIVNLLYSCFPAGTMVVLSFSKTLFKVKKKKIQSNQKHMQASSGIYIKHTGCGGYSRSENKGRRGERSGQRVIRTDEQKHANASQNKNKGSGHTTYQKHPCAADKKDRFPL